MTRMVQLSDAAYERLKNAKRPRESFSDVVVRLTGSLRKGRDLLAGLGGLMTEAEGEAALRTHEHLRKLDRRDRWME